MSVNSSNVEFQQKHSDVTVYVRCDISEQYIWIMLLSPNTKKALEEGSPSLTSLSLSSSVPV